MNLYWRNCWYILLILAINSLFPLKATGQIRDSHIKPDNSLGSESSTIGPNIDCQCELITGGAIRGNDLFHSFQEFNIGEGARVYFHNPVGIMNILSRVTGNNPSQILGRLGVTVGNANLFLINPNGIMFGPGATLDISGSFVASSASGIILQDGSEFSATNPQTPPLLTVKTTAPVGLRFEGRPGIITSQAELAARSGQNIALIGGDVALQGGELITGDKGRIDIGSVQDESVVHFIDSESGWTLDYQDVNKFGDIDITNKAIIGSNGNPPVTVDIHFQGQNIILSEGSQLVSSAISGSNGGNISLNASDLITLTGNETYIKTDSYYNGNAKNISIETENLTITNGARIHSYTGGKGDSGDINIQAQQIILEEVSPNETYIKTDSYYNGNAGNISIETENLIITNGAEINSDTEGKGDSGDINIQAQQIIVDNAEGITSFTHGEGNGGSITIENAEFIEISGQGATGISTRTFESGNAGNITIETETMVIKEAGFISASAFDSGNAGNIEIFASESIELNNQNQLIKDNHVGGIFSQTAAAREDYPNPTGNAGSIKITTESLTVLGGMPISSASRNNSQAGNINITATSILLSGTAPDATELGGQSGIFVSAEPAQPEFDLPPGSSTGNLEIETSQLIVEKGAKISADTFGLGDGGDVILDVDRLIVRNGGFIRAGSLVEENAPNTERGNGGSLSINASESLEISGSGKIGNIPVDSQLLSASQGTGNAGDITINTPELIVEKGGIINVDSTNIGIGGDIEINSENVILNQGIISAESTSGRGGNITMSVNDTLELRFGSEISTTAGNEKTGGDGGNITLNPARFIFARPEEDSNIRADAFTGDGGRIEITTEALFGIEPRDEQTEFSDITASSEFGVNGEIIINRITTDPTILVDEIPGPTENITFLQACSRGRRGKIELFDLGRGGLPIQPEDPLRGSTIIAPWIPLTFDNQQETSIEWSQSSASTTPYSILVDCRGK